MPTKAPSIHARMPGDGTPACNKSVPPERIVEATAASLLRTIDCRICRQAFCYPKETAPCTD